MPPSRRRPVPSTPTVRPRVAGLRKRPAAPAAPEVEAGPVEADQAGAGQIQAGQVENAPAAAEPDRSEGAPGRSPEVLGLIEPREDSPQDIADRDTADRDTTHQGTRDQGTRDQGTDDQGTDREPKPGEAAAEIDIAGQDIARRGTDDQDIAEPSPRLTGSHKRTADRDTADRGTRDQGTRDQGTDREPKPGEAAAEIDIAEPTPTPRPRPTGRRKRTGEAVPPSVLTDPQPKPGKAAAETDRAGRLRASTDRASSTDHSSAGEPSRTGNLVLPIALFVLAALLVGLGVWFQHQAGNVRYNQALVDSAGTTKVAGQAREAVEKAFSYNFADVSATEKAANELLVGRAKCQYNAIFGPVRTLAPEQKLVVTVKAVSSGVTSLDGDRATVLLLLDQVTTRTTDNQSGGGIAMMRVGAQEVDGRWKVDNMEMFGQTGDQAAETAKCSSGSS